jgi:hypothetical protein
MSLSKIFLEILLTLLPIIHSFPAFLSLPRKKFQAPCNQCLPKSRLLYALAEFTEALGLYHFTTMAALWMMLLNEGINNSVMLFWKGILILALFETVSSVFLLVLL